MGVTPRAVEACHDDDAADLNPVLVSARRKYDVATTDAVPAGYRVGQHGGVSMADVRR